MDLVTRTDALAQAGEVPSRDALDTLLTDAAGAVLKISAELSRLDRQLDRVEPGSPSSDWEDLLRRRSDARETRALLTRLMGRIRLLQRVTYDGA